MGPFVVSTWLNVVVAVLLELVGGRFATVDFGTFSHPSLIFLSRPWVWPGTFDTALLLGCGLVTAVPLMVYANRAKLPLPSTIAMLQ